jgi:hypothetical protein
MTWRSWRRGVPLVLAAGVALAACSLLVPLNEQQCTVSADCSARGGPFVGAACVNNVCVAKEEAGVDAGVADADPWGCLDQPPEVVTADPVAITFKVFNAIDDITTAGAIGGSDFTVISYTAVPGVSIRGCSVLDVSCMTPVTPPDIVTDDAGEATVLVLDDLQGYFQFVAPGYLSTQVYPGRLLADASVFQPPIALLPLSALAGLAFTLKVPLYTDPDAGVGQAFFQLYDCFDRLAQGVTFTLSIDAGPQTVQWYYHGGFPSLTSTETDQEGTGGVVNVPAGAVLMTATLAASHRTVGTVNTVITAGWATFDWVRVRTQPQLPP